MRNSYIAKISSVAALAVLLLAACRQKPDPVHSAGHKETPLDSSVQQLTKPANLQVKARIPVVRGIFGSRIITTEVNGVVNFDTRYQTSISSRVSGRIEKLLIRYNYQPVKAGQLIMELYSPDLAAAQQELLYLANSNDHAMLQHAKEKLQLLGMHTTQINEVLRSRKIMYRVPVYSPASGYILERTATPAIAPPVTSSVTPAGDGMSGMGSSSATPATNSSAPAASPVLLREGQYVNAGQSIFTIYRSGNLLAEFAFTPAMAANIQNGQSLLMYANERKDEMVFGKIGLIEPVFRNGENFTVVRVYLNQQGFQAGQLLTAAIPVLHKRSWWLPKDAVWMQGQQRIIFLRSNGVFVPVEIRTGESDKEMIQVLPDLSNLEIAANAHYLVDSESFIKVTQSLQ